MSQTAFTLTHKGWFGLCPVYFADPFGPAPMVEPRHWTLTPLMMLSEGIYAVAFTVWRALDPAFEPSWPLRITGELAKPITLKADNQ